MQKFLVTYLATLILFQGIFINTDVLVKINELIADYQLHKVKYGDNLTTFASKHFGNLKESHEQQHKEEHKEHNHPQKDFNINFQTDFIPLTFSLELKNCIVTKSQKSNFFYQNLFSTFEKPSIFQPPRIA